MDVFDISFAFLMGLTGSLHCAGMCGHIVLVMPFQHLQGIKKILSILTYHSARICVYMTLGLLLFSFKNLFSFQIQQYISLSLGIILFLAGLFSLFPNKVTHIVLPWTDLVMAQLKRFISNPSLSSFFLTGFLNGLLPCGMVYMALSAAISTSNTPLHSMNLMFFFGLGTLPMLIAFTILKTNTQLMRNLKFRKWIPVLMALFGIIFILRGLGLGIPYISPRAINTPSQIQNIECH